MRTNPDYALEDPAAIKELIRANPWCTFVSHVPGRGLIASHYPVLLDEEADGIVLLSHVGRPDEAKHDLGRHELLAVIQGPHGYVSPSWYDTSPAVPTWNFAVVHAYGLPERLTTEENLAVLERLVDRFELSRDRPFRLFGTPENAEYAHRIVHGTVGFRMPVTRIEAKNKMSQDKPADVVDRVIAAFRQPGPDHNPRLADHMAAADDRPAQPGE